LDARKIGLFDWAFAKLVAELKAAKGDDRLVAEQN